MSYIRFHCYTCTLLQELLHFRKISLPSSNIYILINTNIIFISIFKLDLIGLVGDVVGTVEEAGKYIKIPKVY